MPDKGELDRRINIERASVTQNAFNEDVETWALYKRISAKREDVSDGEKNAGGQIGAFLMTRFIVENNSITRAIKGTDRIVYQGAWSIKGVKEARDPTFLEITAVKDADS